MSTLKSVCSVSTKGRFLICRAAISLLLLAGCAPSARVVGGGGSSMERTLLDPYSGPRARIAVATFEDKTARGYGRIGEGLAVMCTTALVNSQRFIVLERDQIGEVIREQDLAGGGRVKPGTGAATGEIEGAELLLTGAVTEFEPEKIGLGGGIIGLGTFIGTALLHEKDNNVPIGAAAYLQSHIVIDVRLVDAATSRIVAAVTVEGQGHDWGGGVIAEVGGGRSELPLAFGGFQHAATEQAVRRAVDMAVSAIALKTPRHYFHYDKEDFSAGRIVGFSFLDLPGLTGEGFPERGFRSVENREEWMTMAHNLGLEGRSEPVDFASRRVVVLFAGAQDGPGKKISVEKVVAYPQRIEITASVAATAPSPAGGEMKPATGDGTALPLSPVVLLQMENSPLPVTVRWRGVEGGA